jgi:hypothetical protein
MVIEKKLRVLKKYQKEENLWLLKAISEKIKSTRTWMDLCSFVDYQQTHDTELWEYMVSAISFLENMNETFLSLIDEEERKNFRDTFHERFSKKAGPISWPISHDTMLNHAHLGAILMYCLSPDYGHKEDLVTEYNFRAILRGESEPVHVVAIIKFHALYSCLQEALREAETKKIAA